MRASARDHLRIAQAEAHAPARHVVALRHREDLDGDFLGALHLQDAGRLVAVEAEIGVREIVHDHGAVLRAPGGRSRGRNPGPRRWWWDCAETKSGSPWASRAAVRYRSSRRLRKVAGVGHGQHAGVAFGHDARRTDGWDRPGFGETTTSPGPTVANSRCASASLAPMVTMASVSGSSVHAVVRSGSAWRSPRAAAECRATCE